MSGANQPVTIEIDDVALREARRLGDRPAEVAFKARG